MHIDRDVHRKSRNLYISPGLGDGVGVKKEKPMDIANMSLDELVATYCSFTIQANRAQDRLAAAIIFGEEERFVDEVKRIHGVNDAWRMIINSGTLLEAFDEPVYSHEEGPTLSGQEILVLTPAT